MINCICVSLIYWSSATKQTWFYLSYLLLVYWYFCYTGLCMKKKIPLLLLHGTDSLVKQTNKKKHKQLNHLFSFQAYFPDSSLIFCSNQKDLLVLFLLTISTWSLCSLLLQLIFKKPAGLNKYTGKR